jgi:hypothetical protein
MMQYLSTNYNTLCPEMIVVGLLHPDRRKDLIPRMLAQTRLFGLPVPAKRSGG